MTRPDRDPLALSAAVYRAAGREVKRDTEDGWSEAVPGPWLVRLEDGDWRLVFDLMRPERLGELVGLVEGEYGWVELARPVRGSCWYAQTGDNKGVTARGDSPNVALGLALLDATGTPRPEGW